MQGTPLCFLSGPEGGLSEAEERAAIDAGWQPLALGPRILRADTAPLMSLAWIAARGEGDGARGHLAALPA
ncbi:MAG TPA: RsmE family RNA methyltransferase [Burkholderiaceae bacterium]|nr:RsmE family RNA methyltransferase [Burkholderiaceae bacterium]